MGVIQAGLARADTRLAAMEYVTSLESLSRSPTESTSVSFVTQPTPYRLLRISAPHQQIAQSVVSVAMVPEVTILKQWSLRLVIWRSSVPARPRQQPGWRSCGRCHSHHQTSRLDREDSYWIRFQGTTLPWSRCFTESGRNMDCITCHDPHGNASISAEYYDSRCLSCHSAKPSEEDTLPPPVKVALAHPRAPVHVNSIGTARRVSLSDQPETRLRGLPYASISERRITRHVRRPLHPYSSEIKAVRS